MKQIYRKDLHIEDIRTDEYWNRFRIYSILNNEDQNSKFRNQYVVHRAINSRNTVLDICKTSKVKGDGDISFDQMLELSNRTYILENLPIYTFLKLKYNSIRTFCEISNWKYINRDTTFFVRIPKEVCQELEIRKQYENIQLKSIKNYRDMYKKSGDISKKISTNFLPLGIQHRAVISTDIRSNIEITKDLLCSDLVVDNQLGDMFEHILKSNIEIIPECKSRITIQKLLKYLRELVSQDQRFEIDDLEPFKFEYVEDIVEEMITNFEMLINPLGSKDELEFDYDDQVNMGNILKKSRLANYNASKGSHISGFLSLVNIFNLLSNNYQMYIPLFSDFTDIDKELDRKDSECFSLPKSLEENSELRRDMTKKLIETYNEIKEWRKKSIEHMSDEMSKEFTRYLLPFCHMTRFNMYLDINDIYSINNIDFEYKVEFQKLFFQKDPLFKK
jgi:hypothetical protein